MDITQWGRNIGIKPSKSLRLEHIKDWYQESSDESPLVREYPQLRDIWEDGGVILDCALTDERAQDALVSLVHKTIAVHQNAGAHALAYSTVLGLIGLYGRTETKRTYRGGLAARLCHAAGQIQPPKSQHLYHIVLEAEEENLLALANTYPILATLAKGVLHQGDTFESIAQTLESIKDPEAHRRTLAETKRYIAKAFKTYEALYEKMERSLEKLTKLDTRQLARNRQEELVTLGEELAGRPWQSTVHSYIDMLRHARNANQPSHVITALKALEPQLKADLYAAATYVSIRDCVTEELEGGNTLLDENLLLKILCIEPAEARLAILDTIREHIPETSIQDAIHTCAALEARHAITKNTNGDTIGQTIAKVKTIRERWEENAAWDSLLHSASPTFGSIIANASKP